MPKPIDMVKVGDEYVPADEVPASEPAATSAAPQDGAVDVRAASRRSASVNPTPHRRRRLDKYAEPSPLTTNQHEIKA